MNAPDAKSTSGSGSTRLAKRLHYGVGLLALGAFLVSGAYMRFHEPPLIELGEARHASFLSRHIFILAAALLHLVLGSYVSFESTRWRHRAQCIGSGLLVFAAVMLVAAFLFEPVAGRGRTVVSSFGLYALFGGSLAHFVARWGR